MFTGALFMIVMKAKLSVHQWMNEENATDVIQPLKKGNSIFCSKKTVILSERSQTDKNKYHMISVIWNLYIQKKLNL